MFADTLYTDNSGSIHLELYRKVKPAVTITTLSDGSEGGYDLSSVPSVAKFTVARDGSTSGDLLVYLSTPTGSASFGNDYEFNLSSVVIPDGSSSTVVSIGVVNDGEVEPIETIELSLAGHSSYTISGTGTAIAHIADNDVKLVAESDVSVLVSGTSETIVVAQDYEGIRVAGVALEASVDDPDLLAADWKIGDNVTDQYGRATLVLTGQGAHGLAVIGVAAATATAVPNLPGRVVEQIPVSIRVRYRVDGGMDTPYVTERNSGLNVGAENYNRIPLDDVIQVVTLNPHAFDIDAYTKDGTTWDIIPGFETFDGKQASGRYRVVYEVLTENAYFTPDEPESFTTTFNSKNAELMPVSFNVPAQSTPGNVIRVQVTVYDEFLVDPTLDGGVRDDEAFTLIYDFLIVTDVIESIDPAGATQAALGKWVDLSTSLVGGFEFHVGPTLPNGNTWEGHLVHEDTQVTAMSPINFTFQDGVSDAWKAAHPDVVDTGGVVQYLASFHEKHRTYGVDENDQFLSNDESAGGFTGAFSSAPIFEPDALQANGRMGYTLFRHYSTPEADLVLTHEIVQLSAGADGKSRFQERVTVQQA